MAPATSTATSEQPPLEADAQLQDNGRGTLHMNGRVRPINATDVKAARAAVTDIVKARAHEHGAPVILHATDPDGAFAVKVDVDGTITAVDATQEDTTSPQSDNLDTVGTGSISTNNADPVTTSNDSPRTPVHLVAPPPPTQLRATNNPSPMSASTPPGITPPTVAGPRLVQASPMQQTPHPDEHSPVPAPTPTPVVPKSLSASLLPASDSEHDRSMTPAEVKAQAQQASLLDATSNEAPARDGVRGVLNGLGGLRLGPSRIEKRMRIDAAAVAQHWPRPLAIAVVNGKGGACKTPATVLLAATFARYGGAGVVAWDNNSTRGTLGWRTQKGPHEATIEDLLPVVEDLVGRDALAASMARYTHHQRLDRYDVLRSRPEALSKSQPTDAAAVDSVHRVLTKYYRMIFIDSGNDESAEQWQAMIRKADAIVVPTTTRAEHAESARLLLAELAGADQHCANLASNALVVVSQASRAEAAPNEGVEIFSQMTRAAVGIPYDPAMTASPLLLDSLAPATRRAWLAAGAALTGAFTTN